MTRIVFVDTETTRLEPVQDCITTWEIALIVDDAEYLWQIAPDMYLADDNALEIGRFEDRLDPRLRHTKPGMAVASYPGAHPGLIRGQEVAGRVCELTTGAELWGSNPAFDMRHLAELIHLHGLEPGWHYHPNDVPTMARGWCAAKNIIPTATRPDGRIRSDDWSRAIGVDPDGFGRHTALGDCRWVRAQYQLMINGGDR